jgi:hypothetical protein
MSGCLSNFMLWIESWTNYWDDSTKQVNEELEYIQTTFVVPKQQRLLQVESEINILQSELARYKQNIVKYYQNKQPKGIPFDIKKMKLNIEQNMCLKEKKTLLTRLNIEQNSLRVQLNEYDQISDISIQTTSLNERKHIDKILSLLLNAGADREKTKKIEDSIQAKHMKLEKKVVSDNETKFDMYKNSIVHDERLTTIEMENNEMMSSLITEEFTDFDEFILEDEFLITEDIEQNDENKSLHIESMI